MKATRNFKVSLHLHVFSINSLPCTHRQNSATFDDGRSCPPATLLAVARKEGGVEAAKREYIINGECFRNDDHDRQTHFPTNVLLSSIST